MRLGVVLILTLSSLSKMQAAAKNCPRGINILKVDKSLNHVLAPEYAKILEPLTEEELKAGAPNRKKADEFKLLSKLTFTEDHQANLYVNQLTKPFNRYSDILPCSSVPNSSHAQHDQTGINRWDIGSRHLHQRKLSLRSVLRTAEHLHCDTGTTAENFWKLLENGIPTEVEVHCDALWLHRARAVVL